MGHTYERPKDNKSLFYSMECSAFHSRFILFQLRPSAGFKRWTGLQRILTVQDAIFV